MKIAGRKIGVNRSPYIIAEISGNHGGSLDNAKKLIAQAKKAGADAVKTQCYEPDTITLNIKRPDFIVQSGLWRGRTLYELYKAAHTPFRWHRDLFQTAKDEGVTIFSSVFDYSSIDYLETLDCPAYKIASFEIIDTPLIQYAAKTGKPVIISTGMATDSEVLEADEASGLKAAFLHCTSEYPGTIEASDLSRITRLDTLLGHKSQIGLSDHTKGSIIAPVVAITLNATIIEKHLCLDGIKTEDSEFSLTPSEFKEMVNAVRTTHAALTKPTKPENVSTQCRRSLYATQDIEIGDTFSALNIKSIRPGFGLHPRLYPELIGKKSAKRFKLGDPIS